MNTKQHAASSVQEGRASTASRKRRAAKKDKALSPRVLLKRSPPADVMSDAIIDATTSNRRARKKRFATGRLLGLGGLCAVYQAEDLLLTEHGFLQPVAVKRLLPEYAGNKKANQLLAQEFFMARHLSHPGIVRCYELHEDDGGLCYTMELLEGKTLYELMGERRNGIGREAAHTAAGLFEALRILHERGIVHGDVKPANVMAEKDRIVLIDFNTAEPLDRPGKPSLPLTRSLRAALRLPAFSPLHAAPERLEGGPPTPESDVFSACVTLYELSCGDHPFIGKTALEAMAEGFVSAPPPLPGKLRDLVLGGLRYIPAARPSAVHLAAAANACCNNFRIWNRIFNGFIA